VVLCRYGPDYGSSTNGKVPPRPRGPVDRGRHSVLRVRAARWPAASRARPADRADRPSWDRNREDARLNLKTRPRLGYRLDAAQRLLRIFPS
jgi:hypothetical protein